MDPGVTINGIIKNYIAKEDISTGDFVEYGIADIGPDIDVNSYGINTRYGRSIKMIKLNSNTILIVHGTSAVYGTICTISGTQIIPSTATVIMNNNGTTQGPISVIKISSSKVLIVGRNQDAIAGVICTINEAIITVGTQTTLINSYYSAEINTVVQLNNTTFFIAYAAGQQYYLYGSIFTIYEDTINTIINSTQLASNSSSVYYGINSILLSNNKILIVHPSNAVSSLNGMICNINNNTISIVNDIKLVSSYSAGDYGKISIILLSNTSVLISFNNTNRHYLNLMLCTILNDTISSNTPTIIYESESGAYFDITPLSLDNQKLYLTYSNSNYYIYGRECNILDNTITLGIDEMLLSGSYYPAYHLAIITLNPNKVLIIHHAPEITNTNIIYGFIKILQTGLFKVVSYDQNILGIALQTKTANQTINIITPIIS